MLTPDQIKQYRSQYGLEPSVKIPDKEERASLWERMNEPTIPGTQFDSPTLKDVEESYLYEGAKNVGERIKTGAERIVEEPTLIGKAAELGTTLSGVTAETIKTAFAPIGMGIEKGIEEVSNIKGVQDFASNEKVGKFLDTASNIMGTIFQNWEDFSKNNPRLAEGIADNAEILLTVMGEKPVQGALGKVADTADDIAKRALKTAGELAQKGVSKADDVLKATTKSINDIATRAKTTLFGDKMKASNIDDVIKQAEKGLSTSELRTTTEGITSKPSLVERWVNISPDVKNRIAGKQDLLKEYFDVAHARNNFDTLPTVMEHATKYTDEAVTKMESLLNDTGSKIGDFRKKIGTYEANIDQVAKIENSFNSELNKLNLEVKNGQIIQKPGTIKRVGSDRDIGVLNEIYNELLTVKENPNLEKLIDLRNIFDKKITFEKSARDVSNSLDPLSRQVRKEIASEAASIVGPSEAKNLAKYTDFIEAFNDLKSFTDRKAGGEYLLKLVLSGRGGEARRLIQTIKEYTGIDLLDHAVMSNLATELIGNNSQKNLFRQEISKAGLDAYAAATGDPQGLLNLINNVIKKNVLDVEGVYLKAAGGK